MKKIIAFLLMLLASLSLVGCASDISDDALVVGMEAGYQPFNWTVNTSSEYTLPIYGTNQYADGYDAQVAKYLGEKLGREVIIKKTVWDDLIPGLDNGNLDIVLAGMTDTEERRQSIDFSNPYLKSDLAFLVRTENLPEGNSKENPATYEELLELFDGESLVCQANVVGDGFIDTYFAGKAGYDIHHNEPQQTYPLAAEDVKRGAAFAMPAELPVIEAMTNLGGLSVLYVDYSFLSAEDLNGLTVSIGVKKGNTELVDELNAALAELSDETRASMMAAAARRSGGDTTDGELVVGMEAGYQPFNWTVNNPSEYTLPIYGTNQYADGYDVQVAKYLGEKLNKKIVIKKTVWDDLIPGLDNGNLDIVLAGMTDTPERRQSIDFSNPYLKSDLAFLVRTENLPEGNSKENPATYEELLELFDGKSLVCQANVVGDGFIDTYFVNNDKGATIHHNAPQQTYPLAAEDVKRGSAFAMPAELPVIEAMTNLGGLSVLYVDYSFLSAEDLNGLTVSIGVKKGNTELVDELNAALAELSDETRASMMAGAAERSGNTDSGNGNGDKKPVNPFIDNIEWIIYGTVSTIILALFGTFVGLFIGIFIAYGKNVRILPTDKKIIKVLKSISLTVCQIYSTVLRGTPMMVQALIFKYGCQAMGLNWEVIRFPGAINNVINGWLIAGLIVITLNTSAYMGEIVKSGLNGVDIGQVEGARSLGMSASRTSRSIILPQALRNALPTIGNELIVNIKDSSVLNVIAVSELFYRMKDIATTNYAFLQSYIILAGIYLVLTLLATGALKLIERKMDGIKFSYNPFRRNRGEL